MAAQIDNYKCLACTGPLRFVSGSGRLECEFCGSSFSVEDVDKQTAAQERNGAVPGGGTSGDDLVALGWSEEEAAHMVAYSCPSCSAQLLCDDTTATASCPYCGNQAILLGQLTGVLKPSHIIPFRLDKQAAVEALKKYYTGKKLLPKSFLEGNHIEEVKGVYVPFWLFDAVSHADIRYNGTIKRSYIERRERVTITEYYDVKRQGDIAFERIPVDASTKMPDAHMDAIEPFDYSALVPFSTAYLPGHLADKYDVDAAECAKRAHERIKTSTVDAFAATAKNYSTIRVEACNIAIEESAPNYALLPVWLLSTKWNGKSFLFAMNGQTGKLVGDLPVDKVKYWAWFFGIALPLMAILGIFML